MLVAFSAAEDTPVLTIESSATTLWAPLPPPLSGRKRQGSKGRISSFGEDELLSDIDALHAQMSPNHLSQRVVGERRHTRRRMDAEVRSMRRAASLTAMTELAEESNVLSELNSHVDSDREHDSRATSSRYDLLDAAARLSATSLRSPSESPQPSPRDWNVRHSYK